MIKVYNDLSYETLNINPLKEIKRGGTVCNM